MGLLAALIRNLDEQIEKANARELVEVIPEVDKGETPTGTKRNNLIDRAAGKYIVFIDDDDKIPDYYVSEILRCAEADCDAIGINGTMTTNGMHFTEWEISKDHPYDAIIENGKEKYRRYNNHLSPIRRSIAAQFRFPPIWVTEDYEWATAIHNARAVTTEIKISKPMYHYDYRTNKKY